jgi:hypothetical protein
MKSPSISRARYACVCHNRLPSGVWQFNCDANSVGHSPVGAAKSISENMMRGCHDPAGGRGVYAEEEDRSVVIGAQPGARPNQPPPNPPRGGLPKLVALRGGARQNPNEGGRALAWPPLPPPESLPAKPPDEPSPDEAWVDPLYLFGCGLFWRKRRFNSAGWELIRYLKSSGRAARIASAFLAQADNMQRPIGREPQAINNARKPPMPSEPAAIAPRRRWRL